MSDPSIDRAHLLRAIEAGAAMSHRLPLEYRDGAVLSYVIGTFFNSVEAERIASLIDGPDADVREA